MSTTMTQETYDDIMQKVEILFSVSVTPSKNQDRILTEFYYNFKKSATGLSLIMERYFMPEPYKTEEIGSLTEEIFNLCLVHNISLVNAIGYMTGLYIFESQVASAFIGQNYGDAMEIVTPKISNEQFLAYYEPIMSNFTASLDEYFSTFHKDNNFYEQIIVNTYNMTIDYIEHSDTMDMPLKNYRFSKSLNFDISEILKNEKNILEDFMQNKNKFIHIFNENHFLHHLQNDTLELAEDGKIVFGGHSEALTIAYENQRVLLSIRKNYKDVALRELQTKLRHLDDYDTPESKKLISFTKRLIAFIQQSKNARIVPIVILAKEMGLSKAVALKYAKQVLNGSINDASFKKNFDLIDRIH